jgi:hypothetical protein
VSFDDLAKTIDHTLLQTSMTDAEVLKGVNISSIWGCDWWVPDCEVSILIVIAGESKATYFGSWATAAAS